jgi:phosphomannomutase
VPERDGILAGLYLLDLMVRRGKKPTELLDELFGVVGEHFYERIDHPLAPQARQAGEARLRSQQPQRIGGLRVTDVNTFDGFKFSLEDGGWLLIRFSGTEPLVRVYCETTDRSRVQPILRDGLALLALPQ